MRFLLPSFLGLASLASLASAADIESRTTCHTSWGSVKTTDWCTSRTTTRCSSVSTSTVTKTATRSQPVKTVTVRKTRTTTAPATVATETVTVVTTSPTTTTATTTSVSSVMATVTAPVTVTSYSNVGAAPPTKRDVHRRKATPQPEVHCTIWQWHCTPFVTTTTTTSTHTLATSTKTVTSTITKSPTSTSVSTTTTTSTLTSIATSTTISTTTVSTITATVTTTSTYASFYITASGDSAVADGTTLANKPDGVAGEGRGSFNNGNTVFALDSSTGHLYDTGTTELASIETGYTLDFLYFDTQENINGGAYTVCDCTIDGFTLILSCNCNGATLFQTDQNDNLLIGKYLAVGDPSVTPVVRPILS